MPKLNLMKKVSSAQLLWCCGILWLFQNSTPAKFGKMNTVNLKKFFQLFVRYNLCCVYCLLFFSIFCNCLQTMEDLYFQPATVVSPRVQVVLWTVLGWKSKKTWADMYIVPSGWIFTMKLQVKFRCWVWKNNCL